MLAKRTCFTFNNKGTSTATTTTTTTALLLSAKFAASVLLMFVICCNHGNSAALLPLVEEPSELQSSSNLIGTNGGHPILIRWQDFLNFQREQQQHHLPVYAAAGDLGGNNDDNEFIFFNNNDKLARSNLQQRFLVPPKLPTASKILAKRRGDEKRRDFEHGWEQCEFSPISCMLKRRRRR